MPKRIDPPRRQRDARKDASIGGIERHVESTYGLPRGSVQINNPDQSNARSDQKIGTLRKKSAGK
jgi:hypothetical protein